MMNFTALSLSLLWNSPIYCICPNLSSYSCNSTCKELGYTFLPNDISIFKSLRSNINREITFIFVPDPNPFQQFAISFPYYLFQGRNISLFSSNNIRINITVDVDMNGNIMDDSLLLNLRNLNLTLSLSSTQSSDFDFINFKSLSVKNSSLTVIHNEKRKSIKSNLFYTDDESLKLFAFINFDNNSTVVIEQNNITNCTIYYNFMQFKFDKLCFYLTHSSNTIILNNSMLSFSTDVFIFDTNIYNNITLFSFNISCSKIQFIQENCIAETKLIGYKYQKVFNLSVFSSNTSYPISCDFSSITSSYINACINYENRTNIVNIFDMNVGSNSINIIPYSPTKEEIPSITMSYQFSFSDCFTQSLLFTPIPTQNSVVNTDNTLEESYEYFSEDSATLISTINDSPISTESTPLSENTIESEDAFSTNVEYSISDDEIASIITPTPTLTPTLTPTITPTPTPTPTPKPYFIFEPFFFIDCKGDLLVNSIPIHTLINNSRSTKDFLINDDNIDELNDLFSAISHSPYKKITLEINLKNELPVIIPSSIFFRKSFHIISENVNQTVLFNYSNFSDGTTQKFTNIIINAFNLEEKLELCNVILRNSLINCSFKCHNLTLDYNSLIIQGNLSNFLDDKPICNYVYIKIPKYITFDLYPIEKAILINNQTFEFSFFNTQEILFVSNSDSAVCFGPMNNETRTLYEDRINYTFIVGENDQSNHSIITFFNSQNITDELTHFSINARSTIVDVISVDFEFITANPIRVIGDKSVYFNSLNTLFYNNYCLCYDVNQTFDCFDVCKPELGPVLPFTKEVISSTVKMIPIEYVNFTIFGSSIANNPYLEYSLFNGTSFDIQPGDFLNLKDSDKEKDQIAYLTLETTSKDLMPNKNVVCRLSNLVFIIKAPEEVSNLYINFATALFSSLDFIIPNTATLTISSESVDTDVFTLLRFPQNLIFASPTQMCNISCSTIISTIIILSNQQIDLCSEEYNISYKLDLSLLLHTPANISSEYGTSKDSPLKILLLKDQPKSLVDIPDLRFDVSRISSDAAYIEFPDQWNSKIEDVSSKIEIYHSDKTLYLQGKVVDDVYTNNPPTIFHNGIGFLYINDILSTFKIKYCICDDIITNCSTLCKTIGPIIPFDPESITATIKSNPTRHITYIIFGSSPSYRPYFRLNDFSVKSFTLSSDTADTKSNKSIQFVDLETADSTPVVPLNHRFISVSIRPIGVNKTADLKFHTLHLENTMIDGCLEPLSIDDNYNDEIDNKDINESFPLLKCSLSQISLTIDIESSFALSQYNLLTASQSLTIMGKRSLSRIIMESISELHAYSFENSEDIEKFVKFNLSQLVQGKSVSISTLLGSSNNSKSILSVELPNHEMTIEQIPLLKFDLTQVDGGNCFMIFPSSTWVGPLSNLTEKIVVEYGRHDFYQESSKHDDKYDGIPPIVSVIGTGSYYINGILFTDQMKLPTQKPTHRSFKTLGPSAIAGIVIGSVAFVVIVVGIIVIVIQKRKRNRSIDEQTPETTRQVNLGLVDIETEETN